jgi:hypothetical protein
MTSHPLVQIYHSIMRFDSFLTFALLLLLIDLTLGARLPPPRGVYRGYVPVVIADFDDSRSIRPISCVEFDATSTQDVKWLNKGVLGHSETSQQINGELSMYDHVKVKSRNGKTSYKYTVSAGMGALKSSNLWVQVERRKGEGLGQRFKFTFLDPDGATLGAYRIWPNERCTTTSTFDSQQVDTILVESRVW